MKSGRLEAFSDGVFAILITILVLELHAPQKVSLASLRPVLPVFLGYVLSFVFVGIYWNAHHHLMQAVDRVDGRVLWANLHLLFWLSLIPFVTAWMGGSEFAAVPVALYGVVLLGSALAFYLLTLALLTLHPADSALAVAIGNKHKERLSLALYCIAVPLAWVNSLVACALYVAVAIIWLVPDRRIERTLAR
jgi:uncharacterized membrane protein